MAGIAAALKAGALTADAVALEARKIADRPTSDQHSASAPPSARGVKVASLTEHRLTRLPEDHRPPPSLDAYDTLLHPRSSKEH